MKKVTGKNKLGERNSWIGFLTEAHHSAGRPFNYALIGSHVVLGLLLFVMIAGCGIAREKRDIEDEEKAQIDPTVLQKLKPGSYMQTWQMPDGRVVSFTVAIPQNYIDERPVPLILALHYGTEKVTQFFGNQMVHAMVQPATAELDGIIIAPDVINKSWADFRCEECVMALLNEVCKTYNVDKSRILVLGYSMGAKGTWHFAGKHPDFFTAAIPIAGHPPIDYMDTRWTVPMLAIHSNTDEVFPFQVVDDAVRKLQARGDQVQIFPLKDISHYESGRFVEPLEEAVSWVKQVWDSNQSE